jgi:integrase
MALDRKPDRLKYVNVVRRDGVLFLYYRRDGRRLPLTGPEGSAAFLADYDAAHARFGPTSGASSRHTVDHAIEGYLGSATYQGLSPTSKRLYRHYLDEMRERIGSVLVTHIDIGWVEQLRDRLAARPNRWNAIRSRMKEVFARYRRLHPELIPINPWGEVGRISPPRSTQNRRWPDEVLSQVLHEATPEFRALLITLLLTGQRVGDVTKFTNEQYDRARHTLGYADLYDQAKVAKRMVVHVPEALTVVLDGVAGRHPERLLITPRGKPWTVVNAEETLLALRSRLEIGRYTLHGLRKTGVSALKMGGMENRRLRALTGHDSDRNLEVYLDGIDEYAMAREAGEALGKLYAPILLKSTEGANQRRFSGVTGRAATKERLAKASVAEPGGTNRHSKVTNEVANGKSVVKSSGKTQ